MPEHGADAAALGHFRHEQRFWDRVGASDYRPLSVRDQERIGRWIAWSGQGRILDVGGGAGMVSRLLGRAPLTRSVCLDISRAMLAHAPVAAVQADALRLPFRAACFDLVVAAAFFHHLPDQVPGLLLECQRVLVPGGRLVGYDPNGHSIQNRVFMGGGPLRLGIFSPDERPLNPELLRDQARARQFEGFEFAYFSFRNAMLTPFECLQRYLLSPLARGPLRPRLERWFFWSARKGA